MVRLTADEDAMESSREPVASVPTEDVAATSSVASDGIDSAREHPQASTTASVVISDLGIAIDTAALSTKKNGGAGKQTPSEKPGRN